MAESLEHCKSAMREIFNAAVRVIDTQYGYGYAMKNPELLAAVVDAGTEALRKNGDEHKRLG